VGLLSKEPLYVGCQLQLLLPGSAPFIAYIHLLACVRSRPWSTQHQPFHISRASLQALLEVLRSLPDVRVALEKLADDCLDMLRKHHRAASTRQRQQARAQQQQQQQGRQQQGSVAPGTSSTPDASAEVEQEHVVEVAHLRHVRHMAGWLLSQLDSKAAGPKSPSGGGAGLH
jgi:hypothetical protein